MAASWPDSNLCPSMFPQSYVEEYSGKQGPTVPSVRTMTLFWPARQFHSAKRNSPLLSCTKPGVFAILPAMFVGLPTFYGGWLTYYFGITQHLGLAEDVTDHRLNSRTIYMNPIFRFIYWNMNYHVEHHLFPLIPYHALPKLHQAIRADCPPPYPSTIAAYREIIPALAHQLKDPTYYVRRELPGVTRSAPFGAAPART